MRSIRHSLIAAATAAAMLTSCIPTFAFAAPDQEGGAPADVPIIDVTVPTSFILGGDGGIDIQDLGEVSATSSFVNNSNTAVRIKEATCDAAGLNSYFQVNDGNKATFSLVDKQVSWVPSESQGAQSIYTEESESLGDGFVLGRGANKDCSLALDMTGMGLKDAVIEATKERTELRNLMKISWTFERALGSATEQSDFYLKINDEPTHEALAPYKGLYLSLDEVKIMAEDLSDRGSDSAYFNMFKAMVGGKLYKQTEADPTQLEQDGEDIGDASDEYTCKVIWGDTQYDVRVIDVLHDDLSDGTGKAGLTFQFVNLLDPSKVAGSRLFDDVHGNVGWSQTILRDKMNPGGAIDDTDDVWSLVPDDMKSQIETVDKLYGPDRYSTLADTLISEDKLFVASQCELVGPVNSRNLYLDREGTQYAYWYGRVGEPTGATSLTKAYQGQSTAQKWWTRSSQPDINFFFYCSVRPNGSLTSLVPYSGNLSFVYEDNGICPCFCL